MNTIIDSIPDSALRAKLREQHLPGSVRTLTTTEEARRTAQIESRRGPDRAQARIPAQYGLKLWANGARLRVRFIDGSSVQHEIAKRAAQEWAKYANLQFDFGNASDAELRIAFNSKDGSWAYIGTDALGIPDKQPTMNLGFIDEYTALHEFGHVLGLVHENQSPNGTLPWDEKAVYASLQGPPNNWSKEVIDDIVLRQYKNISYRPFDEDSIMFYHFIATWFTDRKARGGKRVLSDSDKEFVRKLYPR